jgi:hypothetical protein
MTLCNKCGRSLYAESSTILGSTIRNLRVSGLCRYTSDVMIVFTQTDLPDPVAPAMRRCGILARSATTTFPSRSLPNAMGSAIRAC